MTNNATHKNRRARVLQNLPQCTEDETLEEDARSGRSDSGKVEKEERNRGEEKKESGTNTLTHYAVFPP